MPWKFTACRFSPQAWRRFPEGVRAVAPARLGGLGDVVGAGALIDGGAKGMLPGRSLGAGHRADAGETASNTKILTGSTLPDTPSDRLGHSPTGRASVHVGLRNLYVDRRNPFVESRNLSVDDANPYVDGPMLHVGASTVYVDGRNLYVATST